MEHLEILTMILTSYFSYFSFFKIFDTLKYPPIKLRTEKLKKEMLGQWSLF